ncbi:uncharacterized protein DUF2480 [Thermoflavifilum aggregans]|uniref:Uncharacterized protein DUF2480 n=1 Tax=Thermoflavifilum aggregans TaxID=454188 RepID=A0A2M9CS34_9BACT|nr:DUF2480 family protein [Thermoflavifilum aggregans]MBX6380185.1 DUF2480 family protein [Thermoflavifilum aggregans]PJJ74661.1 uncharacterized protein DUF2480 [Thermoflavifilum aggregans]
MEEIVNRIAQSGLVTIDLADYFPSPDEIAILDIKDYLFQGLILREKDYRQALEQQDWRAFQNRYAGITCSADAIIPLWAYMLPVKHLQGVAREIYPGDFDSVRLQVALDRIRALPVENFQGQRVLVKGCGDEQIPSSLYLAITQKLLPHVKSLMYGEACSHIPIYKQKG